MNAFSQNETGQSTAYIATGSPDVIRENVLVQINGLFASGRSIVTVEGEEGIGRSTLLRQFAQAGPSHAIPVSISSASRWAYDPDDVALELASQIAGIMGVQLPVSAFDVAVEYRRQVTALSRRARGTKQRYTFVVDGLDAIPERDEQSLHQIVALLPFGLEMFRFLLSSTTSRLGLNSAALEQHQTLLLPPFTREEARTFLADLALPDESFSDVYSLSRGVPGHLASIRRILISSPNRVAEVSRLPQALPALFSREWSQVRHEGDNAKLLLAILAHENKRYTASQLARLTHEDEPRIDALLRRFSFVTHSAEYGFAFVSEAYRRFASTELKALGSKVNDLFIEAYLASPNADETLSGLTTLLASQGRFGELVEYLSPERFARLYQRSPSLRLVQQKADEGIRAAEELSRESDLVRFTLQRCTIEELAASQALVSEIRARTAVGDHEVALALAESSPRPEVRLRLLAALGRARRERKLADDPLLADSIVNILDSVGDTLSADDLEDIATDLFYVLPDRAIDLVARGASATSEEHAIDWGLARLAIEAHLAERRGAQAGRASSIAKRIRHPAAKRVSTAAAMMLGRSSAKEAIASIEELDATGHKLFVLRGWMRANREHAEASQVLEAGVKLALSATGYTANAEAMRELALCLPYISDLQRLTYFLGVYDSQRTTLERLGPADEFIRLQLLLARAEWRADRGAALERLEETYNAISRIRDLEVRAAAIARTYTTLMKLKDEDEDNASLEDLVSVSVAELQRLVDEILFTAADHVESLRATIEALAAGQEDLALSLIATINVEWRRDEAYRILASSAVQRPVSEIDTSAILKAIGKIVDLEIRDDAIESVIRSVASRRIEGARATRLLPLFAIAATISQSVPRILLAAQVIQASEHMAKSEGERVRKDAIDVLLPSWQALENNWLKLDIALSVIDAVANVSADTASRFVEFANHLRESLEVQDSQAALAAGLGLRLAVRAFAGLLLRRQDEPEDFERLFTAIMQIGAVDEQVALLTDIALRCELSSRHEECVRIVEQRLVPLLLSIPDSDVATRWALLQKCAAALFAGAPNTARGLLAASPATVSDEALATAVWFQLTKVPTADPYDAGPRTGYDIAFEDTNKIIALLKEMSNDAQIYGFVEGIVDSLTCAPYRDNLKRAQKQMVAKQLRELALDKFPSQRFIRHEGYLIASLAQVGRLTDEGIPSFDDLAARARSIPNISDRAYVLSIIASAAKASERVRRIEEAKKATEAIPLLGERIDRYESLSGLLLDVSPTQAKELLRKALMLSSQGEGETIEEKRRSLINLAYRVDPAFASTLASSLDDDPAKLRIERQVSVLKLRDSMGEKKQENVQGEDERDATVSRAAWMKLGAMNARRFGAVPTERALPVLKHAARQAVSLSYPIFAWYIENAVRRANIRGNARDQILALFEACLRGAELAIRAGMRTFAQSHTVLAFEKPSAAGPGTLVAGGERESGLEFIANWLTDRQPGFLWIVEPYFAPDAVALLGLIRDACEKCDVVVLASRKDSLTSLGTGPEDAYRMAWNRIRAGDPPETQLIFAGTRNSGKFPIHDRWWLTEAGGLALGTSYNGIGSRLSEIRELTVEDAKHHLTALSSYFSQGRAEFEGERLTYVSFWL